MAVGDACMFVSNPDFLTPALKQLLFQKPRTNFLTCFCIGERRKYTGMKNCINRGSNSQQGHDPDMLTTEPPGRGWDVVMRVTKFLVETLEKTAQEGHDGPVSLHWLISWLVDCNGV